MRSRFHLGVEIRRRGTNSKHRTPNSIYASEYLFNKRLAQLSGCPTIRRWRVRGRCGVSCPGRPETSVVQISTDVDL